MFNHKVKMTFYAALFVISTVMLTIVATDKADAADFTLCNDLSEVVGVAALGRDAGMSPGEIFQLGLEAGMDAEMMAAILNVVFVDMANASPTQIQNTFMAYCLAN